MAGVQSSPTAFDAIPADTIDCILDYLSVSEVLRCARACMALKLGCDARISAPLIRLSGPAVSDAFLTWLVRRLPRDSMRSLELNDCEHVTRRGVVRALRGGCSRSLTELRALQVGGASWSAEELRRLLDACPSIQVLHVNCRTKGASADQLELLMRGDSAVRPHRLILHHGTQDEVDAVSAATAAAAAAVAIDTTDDAINAALAVTNGGTGAAEAEVTVVGGDPANPANPADAPTAADPQPAASGALGATLRRCKGSLNDLEAHGSVLDADGLAELCNVIGAPDCSVRRLVLPGTAALRADEGMEAFAAALASNGQLEQLQLASSFIGPAAATTLAGALHANRALRQLNLHHNPLLDGGASALGRALAANSHLRALSIPFTGMGDAACTAMAHALNTRSALESLDLTGNRLTCEGVIKLAAALPGSQLLSLQLSANSRIGPRGVAALAAVLPAARSLRSLSLDGCAVGHGPCGRLAAALAASRIHTLDLSGNEIGDLGAWDLGFRLSECVSLRVLRLAVNGIEEDGASELLAGLHLSGIEHLDLRGNQIPPKSATALSLARCQRANVSFQRVAPA